MKIGSKIKPRSGKARTVNVHGKNYVFSPVQDKLGDLHYVADVQKEDHAKVFLGSEHFYVYRQDLAAKPTLQSGVAQNIAQQDSAGEAAAGDVPVLLDAETQAKAQDLLKLSASSLSTELGKNPLAVAEAALLIESSKPDARKSVVKLLQSAIEYAKAAGAKA